MQVFHKIIHPMEDDKTIENVHFCEEPKPRRIKYTFLSTSSTIVLIFLFTLLVNTSSSLSSSPSLSDFALRSCSWSSLKWNYSKSQSKKCDHPAMEKSVLWLEVLRLMENACSRSKDRFYRRDVLFHFFRIVPGMDMFRWSAIICSKMPTLLVLTMSQHILLFYQSLL